MSPRARLHVVARGAVRFGEIEAHISEVTAALSRLTQQRSCTEENGCVLVDISWAPAEEECPTSVQMSLIMTPAEELAPRKKILHERVATAKLSKEARDAVDRVLERDESL